MRSSRGFIALTVIIVVLTSGSLVFLSGITPQVTPPQQPPLGEVDPILADDLELVASIYIWQDFLLLEPHEEAPLNLIVRINVTNLGEDPIFGLNVPIVTLYFGESLTSLNTFMTSPGLACCFDEFSIAPGNTEIFQFTNDRETVFSPDLEEGTIFYARLLVEWDPDYEAVLTTSPVPLDFTPRRYGGGSP
ncbi:MAG: hypothetical protein ACW985_08945 [Candidatus Thorarchaeota archaeon]|jgi:hypothetical protein